MEAQRRQPVRAEFIETARPHVAVGDEARLLQHPQMLGDGRTAHREALGQLDHGPGPFRDALEDGPPCGVGQGMKCIGVSNHLR